MAVITEDKLNENINTGKCNQCICITDLDYLVNSGANLFYSIQLIVDPAPILNGEYMTINGIFSPIYNQNLFALNQYTSIQENAFGPAILGILDIITYLERLLDASEYSVTFTAPNLINVVALKVGPDYNMTWDVSQVANINIAAENLAEDLIFRDKYDLKVDVYVDNEYRDTCVVSPAIDYSNYDGVDGYTATNVCINLSDVISKQFTSSISPFQDQLVQTSFPNLSEDQSGSVELRIRECYIDALEVPQDIEVLVYDYGFFMNACCDEGCSERLDDFEIGTKLLNNLSTTELNEVCDQIVIPMYYHTDGTDIAIAVDGAPVIISHPSQGIYFYNLIPDNVTNTVFSVTIGAEVYRFKKSLNCSCKEVFYFKNCKGIYDTLIAECLTDSSLTSVTKKVTPCIDCESSGSSNQTFNYRKEVEEIYTLKLVLNNSEYQREFIDEFFLSDEIYHLSDELKKITLSTQAITSSSLPNKIRLDLLFSYDDEYVVSLPNK